MQEAWAKFLPETMTGEVGNIYMRETQKNKYRPDELLTKNMELKS